MNKIDIQEILESRLPIFFKKYPKFITKPTVSLLNSVLHVREMNEIISKQGTKKNFEAIDSLFDDLNFSYQISSEDKAKIPSEGRLVIIANHPLGGLDGLALIRAVSEVRKDVKIVVNDILTKLEQLKELFLAYDVYSLGTQKSNIAKIEEALLAEEVIIFFPAAKVSRLSIKGVKDQTWNKGAVRFATKFDAPVLPVFIEAKNSAMFYILSLIHDRIGMFLLPREMFKQRNKTIKFKVGNIIPNSSIAKFSQNPKVQTNLLYEHLYNIGNNETGVFETFETIIPHIDKDLVREELNNSNLLGLTNDNKKIYLVDYSNSKNLLLEIARLREITFRKVGEGTGRTHDIDDWDSYYKHIVLYDDQLSEVIGSYRLGITKEIVAKHGKEALYNSSQFDISDEFVCKMGAGIELGRSFIQQNYWKSNALDYMWQGIGAFLVENPHIQYLWGGVSISNSYSEIARSLIVSYYEKWYQGDKRLAEAKIKYKVQKKFKEEIEDILNADNQIKDFRNLKMALKNLGYSVPVLYRRYTELCEFGGVKFISFCVHPNFMNAVDGLLYVDLSMLKEEFKKRYFSQKSFVNRNGTSG